jgi:creatinine amidohydrolase
LLPSTNRSRRPTVSDGVAPRWRRDTDFAAATWTEIDAHRAQNRLVVIPSGALEVYGPHLPVGSDSIVAEEVARRVAADLGALCAPLIPVGYSADLMSFPGTLCVEPDAFARYLGGICTSLIHWGYTDLLFVNTHLGNVALIDQVAIGLMDRHPEVRCLAIDWWRFAVGYGDDLWTSGPLAVAHAGEMGTAVLRAVAEELVREDQIVDFLPTTAGAPRGAVRYYPFTEDSPSGVIGMPSAGSRDKGETVVARGVAGIAAEALAYFVER